MDDIRNVVLYSVDCHVTIETLTNMLNCTFVFFPVECDYCLFHNSLYSLESFWTGEEKTEKINPNPSSDDAFKFRL
jgi:hypothetical protein